jgi:hypothetical protein
VLDWRKIWQPTQTELRQFWGIEWSTEGLVGAAVRLEGGKVALSNTFAIPFTEDRTPERAAGDIAAELAEKTMALGANAACVVVVPRETVVVRQLQLPNVPADELPALVSFQSAAKSSTPTTAIAVDYVPLGVQGDGQAVIAVTLDSARVQRMRDLLTRARLHLIGLEVSPFLIAELVAREEVRGGTPDVPTLIVAQSGDRVEISILDERRVIATHAVWLPEGDAARHVSPLQMEINRCLISLGQSHPGVEVEQVYLVEDEEADEAVVKALQDRFGSKVHPLDFDQFDSPIPSKNRLSYVALIARGLAGAGGIIPRVDLVNPRRPAEKPDNTKRYLVAGGVAAALLVGGTWWNFRSQMASMNDEIENLTTEINDQKADITNGAADLAAARLLNTWSEGDQDQLAVLDQFHQLLPGTDRLYLTDLKSLPSTGVKLLKVTCTARARVKGDYDDLLQKFADAGWTVKAPPPLETRKDPDYPWQFSVEAELPRPAAEKPATTPAPSLSSTNSR